MLKLTELSIDGLLCLRLCFSCMASPSHTRNDCLWQTRDFAKTCSSYHSVPVIIHYITALRYCKLESLKCRPTYA